MKKDVKKKKHLEFFIAIWVVLFLILIVSGLIFFLFFYPEDSSGLGTGGKMTNPVEGLSFEEAIEKFDESFVSYLLINIKAYDLHNPPFSSNTPKIEFYIDDDVYGAEIMDRKISVSDGAIEDEDIIIRTSKEEGVKMILDSDYVVDSFREGFSEVELVAGNLELASKGYLSLYSNLS